MATPVGQVFLWQSKAWIQPRENIIPLALAHKSAPRDNFFRISIPFKILPEATILISFFKLNPIKASTTKTKASRKGIPTELVYSKGAAPVPPSPPSTVIKSGVRPVSCITLQRLINSSFLPIQSLIPIGFPPDNSRKCVTNPIISWAVVKAEWTGGESTWVCGLTPRPSAISGVFLFAGNIPPWPGFAPCDNLISIILTFSFFDFCSNKSALKVPSSFLQPKYPVPTCHIKSQFDSRWYLLNPPSPVFNANPPILAPYASERTAAELSAPKLIADTLKILALYGFEHLFLPISTLGSWSSSFAFNALKECPIHSYPAL